MMKNEADDDDEEEDRPLKCTEDVGVGSHVLLFNPPPSPPYPRADLKPSRLRPGAPRNPPECF